MRYAAAAICSCLHLCLQAQEAQARAEQEVSKLQDHAKSAEQDVKRLEQQLAGSQAAAAEQQEELKKLHQTELQSEVQD